MARSFSSFLESVTLNTFLFSGGGGYTPHPSDLILELGTALPSDGGSFGAGDLTGVGGYAFQPIAFSIASGGVTSNSGAVTFPVATGPWGKVVGWRVYDNHAAGQVTLATGYMGTFFDWINAVDTGTGRITPQLNSPPADGTRIFLSRTDPDGNNASSPSLAGLTAVETATVGTEYYVVNGTAFDFQIAAALGGSPLSVSAPLGATQIWLSQIRTVQPGDQIVFPAGSISITLQ